MTDFIAATDKNLLQKNGLHHFEALWALKLPQIDEPNTERGGWSNVCYLTIGNKGYYLKRQTNHLTRSLKAPFGKPTFAREFRNIQRYQRLGIPAVTAAFFGMRIQGHDKQAILLTHALDGWQDLQSYLLNWQRLPTEEQQAIIKACGRLLKQLHDKKILHGCFYPKHIFLKPHEDWFEICLIDLEKTRKLLFGKKDRLKDLDTLTRRTKNYWAEPEYRSLLSNYLDRASQSIEVDHWLKLLIQRNKNKENRA